MLDTIDFNLHLLILYIRGRGDPKGLKGEPWGIEPPPIQTGVYAHAGEIFFRKS